MPKKRSEKKATQKNPSVKAKKPTTEKAKKEATKEDFDGFRGGLSVDLDRKMSSGKSLRTELSEHLGEVLRQELRNQEGRIEKLTKWEDQYKGKKPEKNFPFPKASNVASLLSRSSTDSLFVRLYNTIQGRKKIAMVTAYTPEMVGVDREIESAFNFFLKNQLKFKEVMFDPLMECVKTGTGIIMLGWKEEKNTVYAYASPEEEATQHTYSLRGTKAKAMKYVETAYEGPYIYPIARKDFVISSDAKNIQDAYLVGFRKYYRRPQLEAKTRQLDIFDNPIYDPKQVEKITQPDLYDDSEEKKAERQEKELTKTDPTKPYEIWPLWIDYDVDEDGEEDSIVVTFHRETETILRCVYNELFKSFRPFMDFQFYPVEYAFDGEGVCEILQPIEEALDTIINQRIDSGTLMNAPLILYKPGGGLEDFKLTPGLPKPYEGDIQNDIRIEQFPGPPPQTYEEEDRMVARGDRAIGITPEVMGLSTSDRPVFKEAATKLHEAGRKFQAGFNHVWNKFTETFYMLLDFFAQYQPTYSYQDKTAKGKFKQEQVVKFPTRFIRQSLQLEMAAASELMNQDERLQRSLTVFTLLQEYMTNLGGMGQAITAPGTPALFSKILLDGNDISKKIIQMILDDFDIKNIDELILDLRKSLGKDGLQMILDQSPEMMALKQEMARIQAEQMGIDTPEEEQPPQQ